MFKTFQRRASRIGLTSNKFIISLDLQQLDLSHAEYKYSDDLYVFITLERGSKFSSSSEKPIDLEQIHGNPLLNKRVASANVTKDSEKDAGDNKEIIIEQNATAEPDSSAKLFPNSISTIRWNERLEIIATLYKDPQSNLYQEKNAVIKLKVVSKADLFQGNQERSMTIGKYTIPLHIILNEPSNTSSDGSTTSTTNDALFYYEKESKTSFQHFKETSLQSCLRIAQLAHQLGPSTSNTGGNGVSTNILNYPFASPLPTVNYQQQRNNRNSVSGNKLNYDDDEGDIRDDVSVSSLISHESEQSSHYDVGFDYSDLRETRAMNVLGPTSGVASSTIATKQIIDKTIDNITTAVRRTSLLGGPGLAGSQSTLTPIKADESNTAHGTPNVNYFANKELPSKFSRSRSMIVTNSTQQTANPRLGVAAGNMKAKSLGNLFPSVVSADSANDSANDGEKEVNNDNVGDEKTETDISGNRVQKTDTLDSLDLQITVSNLFAFFQTTTLLSHFSSSANYHTVHCP